MVIVKACSYSFVLIIGASLINVCLLDSNGVQWYCFADYKLITYKIYLCGFLTQQLKTLHESPKLH